MKRWFAVGMAVLLVSLSAVGCGIPQEEHDAVVAERNAAKAQVVSLQGDLDEAESRIDVLEGNLAATEGDLADTESELATVEEERDKAQSDLQAAKSRASSAESAASKAKSELAAVQGDYEAASTELAEIKEVYPPRDFSSMKELQEWLAENDVSERSHAEYVETMYGKALQIQEDALKDGYIISVDVDYDESKRVYYTSCVAVIDGELWVWHPETDEPVNYSQMVEWQKVK